MDVTLTGALACLETSRDFVAVDVVQHAALTVYPARAGALDFRLAMLGALGGVVAEALRQTPWPPAVHELHKSGPPRPGVGDLGDA